MSMLRRPNEDRREPRWHPVELPSQSKVRQLMIGTASEMHALSKEVITCRQGNPANDESCFGSSMFDRLAGTETGWCSVSTLEQYAKLAQIVQQRMMACPCLAETLTKSP